MLRPKIFSMLWKTWVAYGLPHGFVRHDKILPIQPPNLKKNAFPAKPIFFKMPTLPQSEWPQVAASGRKWPPQTLPSEWPQVAASGRSSQFQATGRKWPQVAAFCDFNFHPQSNIPGKLSAELAASYQCVFFFFFLSQVLRLARKRAARSYEVLHLS